MNPHPTMAEGRFSLGRFAPESGLSFWGRGGVYHQDPVGTLGQGWGGAQRIWA